jgi:primosomal protein N' (replication factor Y)
MSAILRIALPVPLGQLFDYRAAAAPASPPVPGTRVLVPFGRGRRVGVVVAVSDTTDVPSERLREILQVLDPEPLFDAELRDTIAWAAGYWQAPLGEAYAAALPLALRTARPLPDLGHESWALTAAGSAARTAASRRGGSAALLDLLAAGTLDAAALDFALPGWRAAARRLQRAGLVARGDRIGDEAGRATLPAPPLSAEQQCAVTTIAAAHGRFQPFLLQGVTGSGKTEVYLALIGQALARGEQTLLLVPEIGLAPQTLRRLRERLGVTIAVLHSNLAEGARARAWLAARAGSAGVIVGTRSAVFTPLPRAGLIIVDEEHDSSYKQQEGFRYHARDLAVMRARAFGVPVLLGSATPSLESLANVESGRYALLRLLTRPGGSSMPRVQVLDLRRQRAEHGLSPPLLQALDETLGRGEQALVFKNRRGYAPVLLCHACGWHAECPRCQRPLTLHAARATLLCHHCGHAQPIPAQCPACAGGPLQPQGHGTERLEQALQVRYPSLPVLRVDRETTRGRDGFAARLAPLAAGGAAVLVGTQMLAKGHDLPNLTLVAIVGVDAGLYSVDFRAPERLAQLIVQVAGRAGRAAKPGRVLLQTHHPDHPLLQRLLAGGYTALAKELLAERRAASLPPYAHQALLRAQAPQRTDVDAFLSAAAAALPRDGGLEVAGPWPAPLPRRAGLERGQLLVICASRATLHGALTPWHAALAGLPAARRVRWSLDVDPADAG